MREIALTLGAAAVWSLLGCDEPPSPKAADGVVSERPTIMAPDGGHAIGGYDAVAYFLDERARKGRAAFSHHWRGATWMFASSANRDLFASDPSRYAPVYGGWCAFGVAEGYAAESDPENAWTLHQGKLYLNWDAEVARDWRLDIEALLEQSEANWPELRRALQDGSAELYWHDE